MHTCVLSDFRFDEIETIRLLTRDDIEQVPDMKRGHVVRIVNAIEKLKLVK